MRSMRYNRRPGCTSLWGITLPCSREFNSILTAIIGQSELLLGDLPAGVRWPKTRPKLAKPPVVPRLLRVEAALVSLHRGQQFIQGNGGEAVGVITHRVGDDEFASVQQCAASFGQSKGSRRRPISSTATTRRTIRQIRVQKRDDGRRGFSRWHLERLSASPRGIERSESGLGLALIIPRGEPARQQS